MINLSTVNIDGMALHRVGNKYRAERNFVSTGLFHPNEAVRESLIHYFLKSMKNTDQYYQFQAEGDLYENPLYKLAAETFVDHNALHFNSIGILEHLYAQSKHPNIKSGEVFVVYFRDIQMEDELIEGIGIFKSEQKNAFLEISPKGDALQIKKNSGINIEKLDKGCLILNIEKETGFRVVSIDNNRYDTNYWLYHFLNVDYVRDESFHTKAYLELCNSFSNEVVGPTNDTTEKMKFLSDSVDYFAKHESFNFDDFTEKVIPEPAMAKEFKTYQKDYSLEDVNEFEISPLALKKARRKIKTQIKLDTAIQINLDYNNPEFSQQFLEKGFDEDRKMHFYKVFFNDEL